jgi:hypothetical protein
LLRNRCIAATDATGHADLGTARARTEPISPTKGLHDLVQPIESLQMIISSHIFEAHLECSTKCWLRSRAEPITGNTYAEWARAQNEAYYEGGLKRLFAMHPESDRAMGPPISKNSKDVTWRIAIDLRLRTNNLETHIRAVEKMPFEGRRRNRQVRSISFRVR